MEKRIKGIIVSSIDYKDTSKIIKVFTNEGFYSFILKGANNYKSEYKVIKDTLKEVEITFNYTLNKDLFYVSDFTLLNDYLNIKNNYLKYESFFYLVKYLYKVDHESNNYKNKLYDIFYKTISLINNTTNILNLSIIKSMFLIKLTYFLGINPNFKYCVVCNDSNPVKININGALCHKHSSNNDIDINLIYDLYKYDFIDENKLFNLDINEMNKIEEFVKKYYTYIY